LKGCNSVLRKYMWATFYWMLLAAGSNGVSRLLWPLQWANTFSLP
jgi:hypothetical protein